MGEVYIVGAATGLKYIMQLTGIEMEVASVPVAGQHATITISEIECGGSRSVNYLEWAFPLRLETSRVGNDLFHDPVAYLQGARYDFFVVVSGYFLFVVDESEVCFVSAFL